MHHGIRHLRSNARPEYVIHTCSRRAFGRFVLVALVIYRHIETIALDPLQARDHHEPQHRKEEDYRMKQKTIRRCGTHRMRNIYKVSQQSLGKFIGLWICNDEKYKGGYEGVFGL